MNPSFTEIEAHRLAGCRMLDELFRRRLPSGGWSHIGSQFGTEPTAMALLALHLASIKTREQATPLLARQGSNGLWPGIGGEPTPNFWATAIALNAMLVLGADPATLNHTIQALIRSRPAEVSWLVRLKFRFADRHVQFDPKKYGWPWVPESVSWVAPTAMALIALNRAKKLGLVRGSELEHRLRLGVDMLTDRACMQGGWNAGNAVVYGSPLRPHIETTALAVVALRLHHDLPIVHASMTWLLSRVECPSAYSLAWIILAASAYKDVRPDVGPAHELARNRLVSLVKDPRDIDDTSTIALAALALSSESNVNPFGVAA
ncbi:MAG: prenyltransferase/squalene oxidase repeat-containing protein [Bryobacteraceae bacterium]